MKTITEFFGLHLNNALKASKELAAAGKTPEEIQQALGSSFKAEGDKLKFLTTAMELIKERSEGLKRVVVLTIAENEKVPPHTEKRDEHYYLIEYFPGAPNKKFDRKRRGRDNRDRGKNKGKRGKRFEGKPRREGAPSIQPTGQIKIQPGAASSAPGAGPEDSRPPRRSRRPRFDRAKAPLRPGAGKITPRENVAVVKTEEPKPSE